MAIDKLTFIISQASLTLKQAEYTKSGNSFYLHQYGNWGVVNFQKSRDFTGDNLKFTINFGICSSIIRRLIYYDESDKKPDVFQCEWRVRVNTLKEGVDDFWYIVSDN